MDLKAIEIKPPTQKNTSNRYPKSFFHLKGIFISKIIVTRGESTDGL